MATFQENLDENNLVAFIMADIQFHRLIANATRNRTIEILMNTITRHDFDGWKMTLRIKGRPLKTVAEHNRIFKAIAEGGEIKTRSAMKSHLKRAVKNLQEAGFESAISDG